MSTKGELQSILKMENATEAQKQDAQIALDALDSAPATAPAPKPAPKTKHYMDWIPTVSPAESAAYRKLVADFRADIDRRLKAAAEATAEARESGASVAPQDVKTCLQAIADDPTSTEQQVLEAKIALANREIADFHEARARRQT